MFYQYTKLEKLLRVVIFVILAYLTLAYIPTQKLNNEDMVKIISSITVVFLIYDFYFPAVKIELTGNSKDCEEDGTCPTY